MLRRFLASVSIFGLLVVAPGTVFAQDTSVPGDVERLRSMPGNASVHLSWDMATDDTGVTGYKIYYGTDSVKNQNENKYTETVDAGDVIEYSLTGLQNGTAYYFAVTAYDAAGNESDHYSPEVSATPEASLFAASALAEFGDSAVSKPEVVATETAEDSSAPKVVKAAAIDKNMVQVTFSEKVTLPAKDSEAAFVIQDNLTLENLNVLSAIVDPKDVTGVTVLLKTQEQIPETEYVLTAGPEVSDADGNSVESGKEDSAIFAGVKGPVVEKTAVGGEEKTEEKLFPAAEEKEFSLEKVDVMSGTILSLTFTEPVVLSLDPVENFSITEKENTENALEIVGVEVNDSNTIVTLTTAPQGQVTYTLTMKDVMNEDEEELESEKAQLDFEGLTAPSDTTPPEDVRNLVGKVLRGLGVRLQWKGSVNSSGDLFEYIVYESLDGQNYGKLLALPKDALAHQIDGMTPGDHYFKVTARDGSGNESLGNTVKIHLAETGPEIGFLGLISVGLSRFFKKKKAAKK